MITIQDAAAGDDPAGRGNPERRAVHVVLALGDEAAWCYVEFFTANILNPNTGAYLRARNRFLGWCQDRGLTLAAIRPHDAATYIEELQAVVQAPSVKQQFAAIRMLFNWLVRGTSRKAPADPTVQRRQLAQLAETEVACSSPQE